MVSVIENIQTVHTDNDDDDDDSDAPVEITTKTSKTEKKKKKIHTKRRIKYTLATEEDDDDHPNEKRLDEESALTHLVFGDDDDYLEEITSRTKTNKQVYRNLLYN
jgi:hypothetical protein